MALFSVPRGIQSTFRTDARAGGATALLLDVRSTLAHHAANVAALVAPWNLAFLEDGSGYGRYFKTPRVARRALAAPFIEEALRNP